jgi:hypothetical protein
MKSRSILSAVGLLAALLAASPAGAQAPAAPADSLGRVGGVEGNTAAQAIGTTVWTLGGLAGGLTLGPLGAGLAYAFAEGSASALPADVQSKVGRRGGEYSLAYQQAYTRRLVARRKRAAVVGGAAGTALLVVGTVGLFLRMQ